MGVSSPPHANVCTFFSALEKKIDSDMAPQMDKNMVTYLRTRIFVISLLK